MYFYFHERSFNWLIIIKRYDEFKNLTFGSRFKTNVRFITALITTQFLSSHTFDTLLYNRCNFVYSALILLWFVVTNYSPPQLSSLDSSPKISDECDVNLFAYLPSTYNRTNLIFICSTP